MLSISGVTKQYGPRFLYRNASFQINPGEKVGLVGSNGSGKTTLFRLITREESPDSGAVSMPERLVVGYFSQNIEEMAGRTAIEEVKSASGRASEIQKRLPQLEALLSEDLDELKMTQVLEEYGELQSEFDRLDGYNLDNRSAEILTGLGIGPDLFHNPTESFSGGWKMRIALAKILALQPDLLLMDEPTNHLDLESIIWLESWLAQYKGAILMTSHDRDFMNRLVSKIIEVTPQGLNQYSGNYDFYDREKSIRQDQLLASHKRQEDMLAKEKEFIARFAARASHAAQVQSRVKKIEKIDLIEIPDAEKVIAFEWPEPPRGGDEVIKFENLGKSYGSKDVFASASGLVRRLDRVAVVGVNGAGKSTLLKILAKEIDPSSGKATTGSNIVMGYFSQNALDVLDPNKTVFDEVHDRLPTASVGYIRNLLGAFKFSGEDAEKKVSILSGGEKSRVVLAGILAQGVNLLILDEPTNHLDIVSREVLLEAIKVFPGTVMIVSHDRHFLRSIVNRVFRLDRRSLSVFDGNWDYYLEKTSTP